MNIADQYDADYFLRGKQTGKSLYEDYRWLPDLTIPMCRAIAKHCGIANSATILDFGCARGYMVRAFRKLGYNAGGYDISEWAIENVDPEVKPYVTNNLALALPEVMTYDWVIAKDVLEHIPHVQRTIYNLMRTVCVGLFVVVPLSRFDGSGAKYIIEEYEKDVTHCQRWTLSGWVSMFLRPGWSVEASYRVPGVKDNYYKPGWEYGNGFLTVRRLEER